MAQGRTCFPPEGPALNFKDIFGLIADLLMDSGDLRAEPPPCLMVQLHDCRIVPVIVIRQERHLPVQLFFRIDGYSAEVKFIGSSNLWPHSGQTQVLTMGSTALIV